VAVDRKRVCDGREGGRCAAASGGSGWCFRQLTDGREREGERAREEGDRDEGWNGDKQTVGTEREAETHFNGRE